MKKLISILLLNFLFSWSTYAEELKLICTVDDNSYYDSVTIFDTKNKKRAMIYLVNERFLATGDVVSSASSYSINGIFNVYSNEKYIKIGVFRYLINRTTGIFESVITFDNTNETTLAQGYCKKNQPKF